MRWARSRTSSSSNASGQRSPDLSRGHGDQEIFDYAQARGAILITGDKGFSNILRSPPGTHAGIVVVRVPNELPTHKTNQELLRALRDLEGEEMTGPPENLESLVGKVLECKAWGQHCNSGALKHPQFIRVRDDKAPEDCTFRCE